MFITKEIVKPVFDVDGEVIGFHLASEGLKRPVLYQDEEWKVDSNACKSKLSEGWRERGE